MLPREPCPGIAVEGEGDMQRGVWSDGPRALFLGHLFRRRGRFSSSHVAGITTSHLLDQDLRDSTFVFVFGVGFLLGHGWKNLGGGGAKPPASACLTVASPLACLLSLQFAQQQGPRTGCSSQPDG